MITYADTFNYAWKKARAIHGFVDKDSACAIHLMASTVPKDQIIVEFGAFQGRSAVLLAMTGHDVWTVDPMEERTADGIIADHVRQLRSNLTRYPNVTWWRGTSEDVPSPPRQVGMLFIDGDHHAPWPRRDYERFAETLPDGAPVLFHDFPRERCNDVAETVHALNDEGRLRIVNCVGSTAVCTHIRRRA